MNKETSSYIKLGTFVAAGTILLIVALYLIGSKRNVFSSTIKISAVFYNVNGLMPGNNVRYGGIDVGTVDKILIENDTAITGTLLNDTSATAGIKKVINNLQLISDSLTGITAQLQTFSGNINDPRGLLHSLMKDSAMVTEVKHSLSNINQSTEKLNENMKAMQSNFLFRKYFKDKEKKEKRDSLKK